MRNFFPLITVFVLLVGIVGVFLSMSQEKQMRVLYENNHTHEPVDIKLGHFQDTQCGMTIKQLKDSVQAVSLDGKTWFFDDVGCFVLWYKNISFQKEAIVWAYSNDTKKYIDARKAWYSQTDTTVMGYGFGAYKVKQEGMLSFDEMISKMYSGKNLRNPHTRIKLLGN